MDKIFIVVVEWSVDYENDTQVRAFKSEDKAKEWMRKDYEQFMVENPADGTFDEGEFGETYSYRQESGDWTRNHCSWEVKCVKFED